MPKPPKLKPCPDSPVILQWVCNDCGHMHYSNDIDKNFKCKVCGKNKLIRVG